MSMYDYTGLTFDNSNRNDQHAPDINRYLGGFGRQEDSHPFVKGYFYVYFNLPSSLFTDGDKNVDNLMPKKAVAQTYMLSAAEGFTPPGDRQLKYEDVQGMGGVDASFITGQTIDRSFSIQYRDYWGAPIFRAHRQWSSYLNPYYGGVAINTFTNSAQGTMFSANEYKGTCMIIQTKPITPKGPSSAYAHTFKEADIIKVDFFDGVFPVTDLKSAYDSNITDNTIARPTVQYRFDGFPLDETNSMVAASALHLLNTMDYSNPNASPAIYDYLISRGTDGLFINNAATFQQVPGSQQSSRV